MTGPGSTARSSSGPPGGALGRGLGREWGLEGAHGVGGGELLEGVGGRGVVDVDAAAQQLGGVDGAVAQGPGDDGGDGHGQHHRQGEGVVAGHLDHAGQRGERGSGGGGEHRAHGHHGVQGGLAGAGAEQVVGDHSEGHAGGGPDEQRRGEHAAGAADADGQAGGDHLGERPARPGTTGRSCRPRPCT